MTAPLVSIVIPTYNRREMAKRLIESILSGTYKNIEIIVIDDASKDLTSDFLKSKLKNKKNIFIYRNKKNLFAAGSRNEGFKKIHGQYVFFVDDDNVLDSRAIKELVDVFQKDDLVGEVGPVNYSMLHKKKILWSSTKRNMFTTKTNQSRTNSEFKNKDSWETDDIPNAYMVRADIVKKNKIFFNDKYGIMYEESDYAYKIKKAGYKIKVSKKAKIYHDIEAVVDNQTKDYMYHFMDDTRRPFVFARNRVLFHSLYSTKLQFFFIVIFWIWFFSLYYSFKFITYNDYGKFSILDKVKAAISYMQGTINGVSIVAGL